MVDIRFTPQMFKTLRFVKAFEEKNKRGPFGHEVGTGLKMSDSNCSRHMRHLHQHGLVNRRAVTSSKNMLAWCYTVSAEGKRWI